MYIFTGKSFLKKKKVKLYAESDSDEHFHWKKFSLKKWSSCTQRLFNSVKAGGGARIQQILGNQHAFILLNF